jgi:hypothetical protein
VSGYEGNVVYGRTKKRWEITLDPQAMLRAKRLFPKINKAHMGTVFLADSPETARLLQWFGQLHAFEISDADRAILDARVAEHERQKALVAKVLDGDYKPPDFKMAVPPRDYQAQAAALCLESGALVLGDATGTGKTISAFALLADPRALPAVYVTLTALPGQVQQMMAKFLPDLKTHVLKKGTPYDMTKGPHGRRLPRPDVVVTSYSKIVGQAETLAKMGVKTVILDELHDLRHPGTDKYKAVQHLVKHATYKFGMSATLTFGMASQVFWLVNLVKPDVLGDWEEFRREWCNGKGGDKPPVEDPDALGLHLRKMGVVLRRTRKDVGRELPRLQRLRVPVEMNTKPLRDVAGRAAELARIVLRAGGDGFSKMKAAGEMDMMLRMATGIGKAPYVAEFVAALVESGERVVVFVWHREVYAILNERLKEWKPAMYTGSESPRQKAEAKRRFCDQAAPDQTPILMMSLGSAAGIDGLQYSGCHVVVFSELAWTPGCHSQAEERVDRDGQPEPVVSYYLVAEEGSDPEISDLLGLKEAQLTGLMDPGTKKTEKVDQAAQLERVKRLAAGHLARHAPGDLDRFEGARALLAKPPAPDPIATVPLFVPPAPVEPPPPEPRPCHAAYPWQQTDPESFLTVDVTADVAAIGYPEEIEVEDDAGNQATLVRYNHEDPSLGGLVYLYMEDE